MEKYVSITVDSLGKLPGTSIVDNKKETTVTYYVDGKKQVQVFNKPVIIIKRKNN